MSTSITGAPDVGAGGDGQRGPAVGEAARPHRPALPPGPVDHGHHLVGVVRRAGPQPVGGDLADPVAVRGPVEVDVLGEAGQLGGRGGRVLADDLGGEGERGGTEEETAAGRF